MIIIYFIELSYNCAYVPKIFYVNKYFIILICINVYEFKIYSNNIKLIKLQILNYLFY